MGSAVAAVTVVIYPSLKDAIIVCDQLVIFIIDVAVTECINNLWVLRHQVGPTYRGRLSFVMVCLTSVRTIRPPKGTGD